MVVIRQSALQNLYAHGRSRTDVEVCGVLVGQSPSAPGAPTRIDAIITGSSASSTGASVTFTADTWTHIQQTMDQQYPDSRIVGWYHTHPDFGIFLSDMDRFIQEKFFDLPWQVAFVFDPVRQEEGLFVWQDGQLATSAYELEDDQFAQRAAAELDAARRAQRWHRHLTYSLAALLMVLALVLGALLALPWGQGG